MSGVGNASSGSDTSTSALGGKYPITKPKLNEPSHLPPSYQAIYSSLLPENFLQSTRLSKRPTSANPPLLPSSRLSIPSGGLSPAASVIEDAAQAARIALSESTPLARLNSSSSSGGGEKTAKATSFVGPRQSVAQSVPEVVIESSSSDRPPQQLLQKAINTLILDHLKGSGLSYTAQVFIPESRTHPAGIHSLSPEDILQALSIHKSSGPYQGDSPDHVDASVGPGTSESTARTHPSASSPSSSSSSSSTTTTLTSSSPSLPSDDTRLKYVPPPLHRYIRNEFAKLLAERDKAPPQPPAFLAQGKSDTAKDNASTTSTTSHRPQRSLLSIICEALSQEQPGTRYSDASTSTADLELVIPRDSLQRRLQELENQAAARLQEVSGASAALDMDARMMRLQRELNERADQEVAAKVARIEQTRIEQVRMEERAKARQEISAVRQDLEKRINTMIADRERAESAWLESTRERENALETSKYKMRQELLAEMEKLRAKERETLRQVEIEKRQMQAMKAKVEEEIGEAKAKLREAELAEARINRAISEETEKKTMQLRTELMGLGDKLERLEMENKRSSLQAAEALSERDGLRQQIDQLLHSLSETRKESSEALSRVRVLTSENQSLREQLVPLRTDFNGEVKRQAELLAAAVKIDGAKSIAEAESKLKVVASEARARAREEMAGEVAQLNNAINELRLQVTEAKGKEDRLRKALDVALSQEDHAKQQMEKIELALSREQRKTASLEREIEQMKMMAHRLQPYSTQHHPQPTSLSSSSSATSFPPTNFSPTAFSSSPSSSSVASSSSPSTSSPSSSSSSSSFTSMGANPSNPLYIAQLRGTSLSPYSDKSILQGSEGQPSTSALPQTEQQTQQPKHHPEASEVGSSASPSSSSSSTSVSSSASSSSSAVAAVDAELRALMSLEDEHETINREAEEYLGELAEARQSANENQRRTQEEEREAKRRELQAPRDALQAGIARRMMTPAERRAMDASDKALAHSRVPTLPSLSSSQTSLSSNIPSSMSNNTVMPQAIAHLASLGLPVVLWTGSLPNNANPSTVPSSLESSVSASVGDASTSALPSSVPLSTVSTSQPPSSSATSSLASATSTTAGRNTILFPPGVSSTSSASSTSSPLPTSNTSSSTTTTASATKSVQSSVLKPSVPPSLHPTPFTGKSTTSTIAPTSSIPSSSNVPPNMYSSSEGNGSVNTTSNPPSFMESSRSPKVLTHSSSSSAPTSSSMPDKSNESGNYTITKPTSPSHLIADTPTSLLTGHGSSSSNGGGNTTGSAGPSVSAVRYPLNSSNSTLSTSTSTAASTSTTSLNTSAIKDPYHTPSLPASGRRLGDGSCHPAATTTSGTPTMSKPSTATTPTGPSGGYGVRSHHHQHHAHYGKPSHESSTSTQADTSVSLGGSDASPHAEHPNFPMLSPVRKDSDLAPHSTPTHPHDETNPVVGMSGQRRVRGSYDEYDEGLTFGNSDIHIDDFNGSQTAPSHGGRAYANGGGGISSSSRAGVGIQGDEGASNGGSIHLVDNRGGNGASRSNSRQSNPNIGTTVGFGNGGTNTGNRPGSRAGSDHSQGSSNIDISERYGEDFEDYSNLIIE